jgi:hypothetical protein
MALMNDPACRLLCAPNITQYSWSYESLVAAAYRVSLTLLL